MWAGGQPLTCEEGLTWDVSEDIGTVVSVRPGPVEVCTPINIGLGLSWPKLDHPGAVWSLGPTDSTSAQTSGSLQFCLGDPEFS